MEISPLDDNFDEEYDKNVRQIFANSSPGIFMNSDPSHARSVISALFSSPAIADYIGVVTGELDKEIYGIRSIVDGLQTFLSDSKDHKIKIIFEDIAEVSQLEGNPLYKMVLSDEKYMDQIELRTFKKKDSSNRPHFVTINDRAFRWEKDKGKKTASFAVNSPLSGYKIRTHFDSLCSDDLTRRLS